MPAHLDAALAREEEGFITLQIARQQLQQTQRALDEALEASQRSQSAIRFAIARDAEGRPRGNEKRPPAPTNRREETRAVQGEAYKREAA